MGQQFTSESSTASILTAIAGPEAADRIMQTMGGETWYIPKVDKDRRDTEIKREFTCLLSDGGTCMSSYKHLAKKHDLSPRRVMAIVNQ
jgi:Mor family transcriptional regulator